MIQIDRRKITIFNIIMIPILVYIGILALFNLSALDSRFRSCIFLPYIFIFGYVFFFLIKKNVLDIHLIILLLFFIKLYILPVLVVFCGGFNISKFNSSLTDNIFDAVILQTLEWISVIISLCFIKVKRKEISFYERNVDITVNKKVWRMIYLCLFVIIAAIIVYPSLLYKFRPIFFLSETQEILWRQKSTVAVTSINGAIYYPINWLITITRLSFTYLLLVWIWKKRRYKSTTTSIIFSFVIILLGLVLIVPDDVAASIIAAFCLLVMLTKLYPEKRKKIVIIVLIVAVAFFVYMFFGRAFLNDAEFEDSMLLLTQRLNAYFSGFINVAASFDMRCENKITYFLGDFFRSFPVLKGFFVNMPTTTELFNQALGYDIIYNSQIIPLESQAFFYFSYLGVFIVPIFVIKVCTNFYNKMLKARGTYGFFIYCFYSLILVFGLVMYDGFLIFYICLTYVPLLIINIFVNRKKISLKQRG